MYDKAFYNIIEQLGHSKSEILLSCFFHLIPLETRLPHDE